jgi:ABC-type multidrug transport system fused ATPase/permease subunit
MRSILRVLKILWSAGKYKLILYVLIQLILGAIPAVKLLVTNGLINCVSLIIAGKSFEYNKAVSLIIIQFFITGLLFTLVRWQNLISTRIQMSLDYKVEKELIEKIEYISYEMFEYSDFYNHLNRITAGGSIGNRLFTPIKSFVTIVSAAISLFSLILILFNLHWSLVLLSIFTFLPYLYYNSIFGKKTFSLMVFQTPTKRKMLYFRNLLFDKSSVKEVRLFDLNKYFISKWGNYYLKNMKESISLITKQESANIALGIFKQFIYGISSILVLYLIIKKKAKIGDFVTSMQALDQIQSTTTTIASEISNIYSNLFYLVDYFNFIELIERNKKDPDNTVNYNVPKIETIEFKNVTFSYPNSKKDVLRNIDFKINAGEKLAIVGDNGSGKTTLIHCLMGLYEVKEGEILINNININLLQSTKIRKKFTVIFQDFMRYAFSIRENIQVGDIEKKYRIDCEKKFFIATEKSGVSSISETLENGYDTQLGKIYNNGVDFSGGQWQKIAIARSIFRDSEVIILDEPTASLDPRSEYDVYKQFENLSNGKITIYISHRLAYTKNVDKIIVLRDGQIIEEGSHNDLMNLGQVYFEMYQIQSNAYEDENAVPYAVFS